MTATQTIVETNSPVSPDCPLTGKIGNNYIKTDTGLFYQVPGFTGTTNKIADWREHLLPGLPPRCAHNPMTFRVNFSPNIMAVIKPPPSLSRSNCSTSTNQRCKTPVLLWASHTNTTKDGDNIMRAGDKRMSCWQPVVVCGGDHCHLVRHPPLASWHGAARVQLAGRTRFRTLSAVPSAGLCDQAATQMTLQGQVDLASVSGSGLTPQYEVFSWAESYKKILRACK